MVKCDVSYSISLKLYISNNYHKKYMELVYNWLLELNYFSLMEKTLLSFQLMACKIGLTAKYSETRNSLLVCHPLVKLHCCYNIHSHFQTGCHHSRALCTSKNISEYCWQHSKNLSTINIKFFLLFIVITCFKKYFLLVFIPSFIKYLKTYGNGL